MFNYDNLHLAKEASQNAKKSVEALVQQIEQQRPYNKELFNKMDLLLQSNENLLSKLKNNQNGSNNSNLIY